MHGIEPVGPVLIAQQAYSRLSRTGARYRTSRSSTHCTAGLYSNLNRTGIEPVYDDVWVKTDNMRADSFTVTLRNSDTLYIPLALLVHTERHPYFLFPRLWSEFSHP